MAGVGKTQLVLQVARRALDAGWFTGGVLFADMAASEQDRARLYRTILGAHRAP
ncbi:hypothetical protein [Phytomonospora endophytica]|uniref:Nucleoside-triphosphatase THEP1 n=1 Tax=Phytomonospora endophytica TaxID=714109 RepID=A0A841FPK0_9ACTN|nr:hypothetical protein [Phytomonospora endophytica]MBB6038026.1 nucleoside-triphosphatase THEP1 [Phytomonospora endophytica]